MKEMLEKRQNEKFHAIRKQPIYDREIYIPVRNTKLRVLEYMPQNRGDVLPVVFDMHGGGFTNGYPEEDDYLCRRMSDELGIRVFSIEYRLAPEFPYPEGQMDVYESIAYFAEHAEEYKIQADKMVVCGHSAGANLALTAVMRAKESSRFAVRGMILDYPPLDMATPAQEKFYIEGCIPIELSNLFNACYCLPQQSREPLCSPVFASDEMLSKLPPATVITCEFDSLREEAEKFALRLAVNGVEVTLRRFLGEKHAFTIQYSRPAAAEAIQMMIQGAGRYLSLL